MSQVQDVTSTRPLGRSRRLPNERGEWECVRCQRYLPVTAFITVRQTGKPHSYCRTCDSRRVRENRAGIRPRRHQLREVVAVPEYGREDRCIVWETGPEGFCAFVTREWCPCARFRAERACSHVEEARKVLGTDPRERRAA